MHVFGGIASCRYSLVFGIMEYAEDTGNSASFRLRTAFEYLQALCLIGRDVRRMWNKLRRGEYEVDEALGKKLATTLFEGVQSGGWHMGVRGLAGRETASAIFDAGLCHGRR